MGASVRGMMRSMRARLIWCCAVMGVMSAASGATGSDALTRAVEECDRELSRRPNEPDLFRRRGELQFMLCKIRESVADFDREVSLSPEIGPHHWQRGISLYYAGEFARGRAQFESHRSVNPDDVENAAWHFFCVARAEGLAAARAALIPIDTARDRRVPMAEIYALLAGTGEEDAVVAAAEGEIPGRRRQALQYAHLYLGLWHEVNGRAALALVHVRRSAEEFAMGHYMGAVARTHLMLRAR